MFSYEARIKAVNLLIQYDRSYADVVNELEYPSKMALRRWHEEYRESGDLLDKHNKKAKYSEEEKQAVVKYYLEYGKSVPRTIKKICYPICPELGKRII